MAPATAALFLMLLLGCPPTVPPGAVDPNVPDDANEPGTPSTTARDCIGCHTDETLLKAVARVEEPLDAENAGEG